MHPDGSARIATSGLALDRFDAAPEALVEPLLGLGHAIASREQIVAPFVDEASRDSTTLAGVYEGFETKTRRYMEGDDERAKVVATVSVYRHPRDGDAWSFALTLSLPEGRTITVHGGSSSSEVAVSWTGCAPAGDLATLLGKHLG